MLSSRGKQFFLSDMPVLGLFNYRKFLFQHLKVLMFFQVVKSFALQMLRVVRNFVRVISRNSARVQNYSNCLLVFLRLKCFPSSKFEPRSFAKCLQNLLIEKSVERLLTIF